MKKTVSFKIVLRIVAGYGYNLAGVTSNELVNKIAKDWQKIAEEQVKNNNIYVPAIIYSPDWGCPVGGESIVKIEGSCNPQFADPDKFKDAVLRIARALKKELQQSTLTIEFFESDIVYLKD